MKITSEIFSMEKTVSEKEVSRKQTAGGVQPPVVEDRSDATNGVVRMNTHLHVLAKLRTKRKKQNTEKKNIFFQFSRFLSTDGD